MIDIWIMSPTAARRAHLSRTVEADPTLRLAGVATTFPYLRSLMSEQTADVAVIDLQEPSRDWLSEFLDLIPIVLLTSTIWIRKPNPGAILHTDAGPDQILAAIHSVAAGLSVLDPALTPETPENESPVEELTTRESEVLRLLADGLGNRDIATRLSVSEHTIKFHIHSILSKLGAATRTEAVTRGLRSGLIEL